MLLLWFLGVGGRGGVDGWCVESEQEPAFGHWGRPAKPWERMGVADTIIQPTQS